MTSTKYMQRNTWLCSEKGKSGARTMEEKASDGLMGGWKDGWADGLMNARSE